MYFSKAVSLQCTDCTSTIGPPVHSTQFYQNQSWKSAENSDIFTGKRPGWKFLLRKSAGLESISVILLKTDSITGVFWHEFSQVPLFKILEKFLRGFTVIPFIQEVVTLLKMTCLEYIVHRELTFSSRDNLKCAIMFIFESRCQCRDADVKISRWPFFNKVAAASAYDNIINQL